MYRLAPVNAEERYHSRVHVGSGHATVTAPVKPTYCHSAGALHGSSYFKVTATGSQSWHNATQTNSVRFN